MLNDLPLMGFIRDKMKWHQARQTVLAGNIANADTPNYQAKDLKKLTFNQHLENQRPKMTGMKVTNAKHMSASPLAVGSYDQKDSSDFEVTPSGNSVVLEDQMIKVSSNQFDYQMATTVYSRSLGLIKIALGRNG